MPDERSGGVVIIRKTWDVISWILVIMVAVLAFLLAGIRIVGFTPYKVLSGSMEPTYHVGSLVYVRDADPEDIEVGDAITFRLSDSEGPIATHRVVEADRDNKCFYTKGDNNDTQDASPVPYENLVGRATFTIPKLGYFSEWIMNPPGMYLGMAAAGVLLLMVLLPDLIWGKKEKK